MERKSPSREVNTLGYSGAQISSGDCQDLGKSAREGHIYGDGNSSRDVATARRDLFIETLVKINRSSSSCKIDDGLKLCNPTSGSDSTPSKPLKTTAQGRTSDITESNLDFGKMPETKPRVNSKSSSFTQAGNLEKLYPSWWTSIYNWISCNSSMSTMFAMLMVGDDMHSPPRANQIPRIYLTSPGGHERRLSPLSPPKPPIRSPRESIERIKAFPKIPKRQFTTPEKSPEKKPLGAWNRHTSISSTTATSTSASAELLPCGGFRMLSPSKVSRPISFSIPEKFEPAPSNPEPIDFSKEPKVVPFPSLMFKLISQPSGDQDASQPSGDQDASQPSDNQYASQPSSNVDSSQPSGNQDSSQPSSNVCNQQEPLVPGVADNPSVSPENENRLPESLSNPKSEKFPNHSTEDAEVPMGKGVSRNLNNLGTSSQLNESDPLQQPIQEAMKEFDEVFGKYTGNLDDKIAKKLQQMKEFIAKVRRTIVRVTDIGAIVPTMNISDDLTNAMARINTAIDRLKLGKEKLAVKYKSIYSVYINLKYGPLKRSEQETSRLDDLNALRTAIKELRDMFNEVTKIVDSYRDDKKYVEKYVFGDK